MADDFQRIFELLKGVPSAQVPQLLVKKDSTTEYLLVGRVPSPFKQHKGEPMFFAQVRLGKAYVSYHLMPLYMNETLTAQVSPALKKRMQGKSCFNFKSMPEVEVLEGLKRLTDAGFQCFREQGWI